MYTSEHKVLRADSRHSLLRRLSPCQEYHTTLLLVDEIDDLLRKPFPALALVAVGLMCSDREHRIEEQYATVGPGREQTSLVRRLHERWILFLELLVDIL